MKRHIEGLNGNRSSVPEILEGVFLARVDRVFYRWHPAAAVLRPAARRSRTEGHQGRSLTGRLYCTPKALWKLRWFLRDFGYDTDLWVGTKLMKRRFWDFAESSGFPARAEWPRLPQSRWIRAGKRMGRTFRVRDKQAGGGP